MVGRKEVLEEAPKSGQNKQNSERPGLAAVDVTVADETAGDRPWTLSHCKSLNRQ